MPRLTLKSTVFWYVTPCSLADQCQCYKGTCCFHYHFHLNRFLAYPILKTEEAFSSEMLKPIYHVARSHTLSDKNLQCQCSQNLRSYKNSWQGYRLDAQDSIPGRTETFVFATASGKILGPSQWEPKDLSFMIQRPMPEAAPSSRIHQGSLHIHPPSQTKSKAIPVTGREGPEGCETSGLPHLDSRLTDGSKVVGLTVRPPFTPRKIPGAHFC
jgi:hypothetical protein